MSSVAILGGSVVGSVSALQFARSGWRVTLVEPEFRRFARHDTEIAPRPGAPQAVQAHGLMSRAYVELATRVPDVIEALIEAGAPLVPLSEMVPPCLYDGGRPGDAELTALRTRRVTLDAVLSGIVAREPGITRVAARASGLVLEPGPVPRVAGLGLANGDVVRADVVLDAGGRRSPVNSWLGDAGLRQQEVVDRCGVSYYGRHFHVRAGPRPRLNTGFGDFHELPTHLQAMFLGDNDTAMIALCVQRGDPRMKRLRDADAFQALLAANEAFSPWLELLEPRTTVFALGALDNRMRSMVAGGRPVVLGLHQAGDSLSTTNPIRGRGIGMGLAAAGRLHDLVTAGWDDETVTLRYAGWQREVLAVYYREATATDTALGDRLRANLHGDAVPGNAPRVELPAAHPVTSEQVEQAAKLHPGVLRALLRAHHVLDDTREIASAEVTEEVRAVLASQVPSA